MGKYVLWSEDTLQVTWHHHPRWVVVTEIKNQKPIINGTSVVFVIIL